MSKSKRSGLPAPEVGNAQWRFVVPPADGPMQSDDLTSEFGSGWVVHAWHALLWSRLFLEIPEQIAAHERRERAKITGRLRVLEAHYPDADETRELRERLTVARVGPEAAIRDRGRCVALSMVTPWPERIVRSAEFALSGGGEVVARAANLPGSLPSIAIGPYTEERAKTRARDLVRVAIHLVATGSLYEPPSSPYAA